MTNNKNLEEMMAMELHDVWQPNPTDVVIRVPGGWAYIFNKTTSLFIPEPHPVLTYTIKDEDFEDVENKLEILEATDTDGQQCTGDN